MHLCPFIRDERRKETFQSFTGWSDLLPTGSAATLTPCLQPPAKQSRSFVGGTMARRVSSNRSSQSGPPLRYRRSPVGGDSDGFSGSKTPIHLNVVAHSGHMPKRFLTSTLEGAIEHVALHCMKLQLPRCDITLGIKCFLVIIWTKICNRQICLCTGFQVKGPVCRFRGVSCSRQTKTSSRLSPVESLLPGLALMTSSPSANICSIQDRTFLFLSVCFGARRLS